MKKLTKLLAALLAAMMLVSLAGCASSPVPQDETPTEAPTEAPAEPTAGPTAEPTAEPTEEPPAGMTHDQAALAAFFSKADEYDEMNGEKLFEHFDPADPETWVNPELDPPAIIWDENGNVKELIIKVFERRYETCRLEGDLELNGFAELTRLKVSNGVTLHGINVSDCPKLDYFYTTADYDELHWSAETLPKDFSVFSKGLLDCRFMDWGDIMLNAEEACTVEFFGRMDSSLGKPVRTAACDVDNPYDFGGWYNGSGGLYSAENMIKFSGDESPEGGRLELTARAKDKEPYYLPYEGELPAASDMIVSLENGVPAKFDLDFDGLEDTVTAEKKDKNDYDSVFSVTIALGSAPDKPFTYSIEGMSNDFAVYVIDCDTADNRLDVVFSAGGDFAEGIETLHVFRVAPEGGELLDIGFKHYNGIVDTEAVGLFTEKGLFDPTKGIPVCVGTDLLDTQGITGRFTVTNEGLRLISPFVFREPRTRALKRDMEVTVMNDGVPGEKLTLTKGQKIAPYATDLWSWVELELEDGTIVRAELDMRYGSARINGVKQDKYCDMQYAG